MSLLFVGRERSEEELLVRLVISVGQDDWPGVYQDDSGLSVTAHSTVATLGSSQTSSAFTVSERLHCLFERTIFISFTANIVVGQCAALYLLRRVNKSTMTISTAGFSPSYFIDIVGLEGLV